MDQLNITSLFGGTGFILGNYNKLYKYTTYIEPRESIKPKYSSLIYGRGTTTNYHVFTNPSKYVTDDLLLFTETLKSLGSHNTFILLSSWFCEHASGFYSITKLTQEQFLKSYCDTYNIKFKILRLSNIIGGDLRASAEKNALEYMIGKLKRNEDVSVYDGDNYRNFLDIETCCRAIKHIADTGVNSELYNIGAYSSHKIKDLIIYCKDRLKSSSKINIIEKPKFHKQVQVDNYFMDTSKLIDTGFDNKIDIFSKLDNILKI